MWLSKEKGDFLSPLVLPTIVIGAAILQYATILGFSRTCWALLIGHVAIVVVIAIDLMVGIDRITASNRQLLVGSRPLRSGIRSLVGGDGFPENVQLRFEPEAGLAGGAQTTALQYGSARCCLKVYVESRAPDTQHEMAWSGVGKVGDRR